MLQFIGEHFGQLVFRCERNNFGSVLGKLCEKCYRPAGTVVDPSWLPGQSPGSERNSRRFHGQKAARQLMTEMLFGFVKLGIAPHGHGNKPLCH